MSKKISLEETVGRTIASVNHGKIEGVFGDEPTITFEFTDGTEHTIVLPVEEFSEEDEENG